jgi:hypothetical protein
LQVSLAFRTAATLAEAAQTLTSADPAKVPYPTMQREESYPVQFTVDYPDRPLDRLTTGLRILVAIPILIVLAAVAGGGGWESSADDAQSIAAAGGLLFFGPLLMILFRKKYRGGGSTGTWSCSGSALYLAEQATTRAADGSSHVVAGWSAALPPRHMHWLVRRARPGCCWSGPTFISRR